MCSDEALAVYAYLKDMPPGKMTPAERNAFGVAWGIICKMAQQSIDDHHQN